MYPGLLTHLLGQIDRLIVGNGSTSCTFLLGDVQVLSSFSPSSVALVLCRPTHFITYRTYLQILLVVVGTLPHLVQLLSLSRGALQFVGPGIISDG